MFTGLVTAVGRVRGLRTKGNVLELTVEEAGTAAELEVGASVAVSGVCLTATACEARTFKVEAAQETLARTSLGRLELEAPVHLELPLRPSDRLGGHFVQGHVDEVGHVVQAGHNTSGDTIVRVSHDLANAKLLVEKGSIAIDGVSLTVAGLGEGWFEVMLIPHTLEVTAMGRLEPGDPVNLEYDILAKYMARFAEAYRER